MRDESLYFLNKLVQSVKADEYSRESNRLQRYGQFSGTLSGSPSANNQNQEKILVDLSYETPQVIAVWLDCGARADTTKQYFRTQFGSDNNLHECHLAPGMLHIVFGSRLIITAHNSYHSAVAATTIPDIECFAAPAPGCVPGWTEE